MINIDDDQIKAEKVHLDSVIEIIRELITENSDQINEKKSEIKKAKRYIWENAGDLDNIEIAAGMYDVNNEVYFANKRNEKINQLKKSQNNPFFARIDFEVERNPMKLYFGLYGIMKEMKYYVFDWRTPAASLFYNFGMGAAHYNAPSGKISGKIILKRQFKIKGGEIEYCFDNDINIDDEYLQEILSNSSNKKMKNIVNSIQKEQNEIIRNTKHRYLIVQGSAGSGKTSVALHRIAYLIYNEKETQSNNVLIFSPNEIFSEYISSVLPELGEDNVLHSTFSDFARSYLKKNRKCETLMHFLERSYEANQTLDDELIKYKQSNEFKEVMDVYLEKKRSVIRFAKNIRIRSIDIKKEQLNKMLAERSGNLSIFKVFDGMSEKLCELENIPYRSNRKKVMELLVSAVNIDLDEEVFYREMLVTLGISGNDKEMENDSQEKNKIIRYEDVLPILYIKFILHGFPDNRRIRHVIIDEGQDYSMLQYKILRNCFTKASFTVLGDVNQSLNRYYKYDSMKNIEKIFGENEIYAELDITYRSSKEIIDYTNRIQNLDNAIAFRQENDIPVIFGKTKGDTIVAELTESINMMRNNGAKRIGIITKNVREACSIFKVLKNEIEELSLIDNETVGDALADIAVLPSYISKGLEFDGVIVYTESDNPFTKKERYLYYVVCTRALHILKIYNQDYYEKI